MKKSTLIFGLLSGIIIAIYTFIVLFAFGDFSKMSLKQFQMVETFGYLRYLILLLTVFFAMHTYKKSSTGVNYWAVAVQGIQVALLVGVIVGIMEYCYMILSPGFYEKYGHMYVAQMKHNGASMEALKQVKLEMNNYKWMQNPLMTGIFYFFETFLIGTTAALILGIFLKNKKTQIP